MSSIVGNILTRQVVLFALVGVLNTLIDFAVYNLLTRRPSNVSRIKANLCSTSIAMGFSFTVNALLVFQPQRFLITERALKFAIVTAFSLYVVQNVVIYLASKVSLLPSRLAFAVFRHMPFAGTIDEDFVSKNTVKALATLASLVWNFLWYKFFVYAN